MFDRLFINLSLATMDPASASPYGLIVDGALGVVDGRIAFAGPSGSLPGSPTALASEVTDARGALVTPALVDCHTHLVFAGDRSDEFERRMAGATYAEIAAEGGGILSTVRATRAASMEELECEALPRLKALIAGGVGTVEVKSGYGLDLATELKMLAVATRLAEKLSIRVQRTLLGLHAVPADFPGGRAAYVDFACDELIVSAVGSGLVDAADAYCDTVGFTAEEVRRFFDAAQRAGLPVKIHAEQLSNQNGAMLASRYRALSADHLEHLDEAGVRAMAEAGSVAVLLPGAYYSLGETRKPPVSLLRRYGVPMAVATDLNPGTSPLLSPTLAMNMAAALFGLSPEEALAGMTRNGARALGLSDETGMLRAGLSADFALWRVRRPAEIVYWIGATGPERLYVRGLEVGVSTAERERP